MQVHSSEAYANSRGKDYRDLLFDISESKGQLGYANFTSPLTLEIKGKVEAFKSNIDAKAFILRTFW